MTNALFIIFHLQHTDKMKKYDYPDLKETYVYPQKIIFNKYFIFKIGSQQLCINFDF